MEPLNETQSGDSTSTVLEILVERGTGEVGTQREEIRNNTYSPNTFDVETERNPGGLVLFNAEVAEGEVDSARNNGEYMLCNNNPHRDGTEETSVSGYESCSTETTITESSSPKQVEEGADTTENFAMNNFEAPVKDYQRTSWNESEQNSGIGYNNVNFDNYTTLTLPLDSCNVLIVSSMGTSNSGLHGALMSATARAADKVSSESSLGTTYKSDDTRLNWWLFDPFRSSVPKYQAWEVAKAIHRAGSNQRVHAIWWLVDLEDTRWPAAGSEQALLQIEDYFEETVVVVMVGLVTPTGRATPGLAAKFRESIGEKTTIHFVEVQVDEDGVRELLVNPIFDHNSKLYKQLAKVKDSPMKEPWNCEGIMRRTKLLIQRWNESIPASF